MGLLKPATGAGYLKAGFLGFGGSGKTYTATELALGTRRYFGLDGPLAMYDTESGSDYIRGRIREETGRDLLVVKSRSLVDLLATTRECVDSGVAVLIADSITHVWREVCDSYLAQVNEKRRASRKHPRSNLEFQDWGPVKARWAEWTDLYLNSPLHIVICGRAGYIYDFEVNDRGKKELVKSGTKMKAESEFGFEPSLLVEMERVVVAGDDGSTDRLLHRATVIKDRFGKLDARSKDNPSFAFFQPFVEMLNASEHTAIDTSGKTDFEVDAEGNAAWDRERREREILLDEIKGLLVKHLPGQSAKDKKAKVELLEKHFDCRGWEKMKAQRADDLRRGMEDLRAEFELGDEQPPEDLPDWMGPEAA